MKKWYVPFWNYPASNGAIKEKTQTNKIKYYNYNKWNINEDKWTTDYTDLRGRRRGRIFTQMKRMGTDKKIYYRRFKK